MPTIEVSQNVYRRLQQLATPLEDTADDIIRRLLDGIGEGQSRAPQSESAQQDRVRRTKRTPVGPRRRELVPAARRAMSRKDLEAKGFQGFLTVGQLSAEGSEVPRQPGVYAVLRQDTDAPKFLPRSHGGHFKGNDPTVPVSRLQERWVEGAEVLYFGKGDNLKGRIDQLCDFAAGNPVGHWGGRLLWQVDDSKGFVVAWLPTPDEDPFAAERELMLEFRDIFGVWPLANVQGPRKQA